MDFIILIIGAFLLIVIPALIIKWREDKQEVLIN